MEDAWGAFQISRTTEEREEISLLCAHEAAPGKASVESGEGGVTERPHILDSAWTIRSRTSLPGGRRNASALPRERGMSKQDPHRWPVSPREV